MKTIFLVILILQPFYKCFARGEYLFEEEVNFNEKWVSLYKTEEQSIQKLIEILEKSEMGAKILLAARRKALVRKSKLTDLIKGGNVSLTDTTLVRKFSPQNPEKLFISTRAKIYIDRGLKVIDAIMDLAHELTHFALRSHFNPYKKSFALKSFIVEMIEGKGGEVEAYLVECRVYKELFPKYFYTKSNCLKIYNKRTGRFSRQKGVAKFYQIGGHFRGFRREVKNFNLRSKDFPHLSSRPSYFISSSYGLPYPVAAVKEFLSILRKVCQNDLKRLQFFQNKITRSPTFEDQYQGKNKLKNMKTFILSRCQKYL